MKSHSSYSNTDLLTLISRMEALAHQYRGWHNDFVGEHPSVSGDDLTLLGTTVQTLFLMNDAASSKEAFKTRLCDVLATQTFTSWSAIDRNTGTRWDPLVQSYQAFCAQHPDAEPYEASHTQGWPQKLHDYLTAHLPQDYESF